jgi:hypothetical protein
VFVERFFEQQFKRSVMPDGPKVGSVSLSPRADWRMPSDASKAAWLRSSNNGRTPGRALAAARVRGRRADHDLWHRGALYLGAWASRPAAR